VDRPTGDHQHHELTSGNQIEHVSGSNTYKLVWGSGSPYPNYNGVDTLDYKFVLKQGKEQMRFQQSITRHFENTNLTCTTVITYKITNGKVQVDDFDVSWT
jgi:hypothetical protein